MDILALPADGDSASAEEFPWQVQILQRRRGGYVFVCGGALLGRGRVVTAAHCFGLSRERAVLASPGDFKIVVGKTRLVDPRDNVLISDVSAIAVHPNFVMRATRPAFDVAIVSMKTSLDEFSSLVMYLNCCNRSDVGRLYMKATF